MKLLELKMKNIGPYKNEIINFETNLVKNIVLVCGENGAGKTTILKSIKLGMFGSHLYGFKLNSKSNQYVDEVKSLIRNRSNHAKISILFSIVEDFKEKKYEIIRTWDLTNGFRESVSVYVDRIEVFDDVLINTIEYINHYFTPKIIDSIMFDGEQIIGLIENGMLTDYVKESIIHLFGLDYYLDLIEDLDKYLNQDIKKENLTLEQISLNNADNKLKINKKQLLNLKNEIQSLNQIISQKDYDIDMSLKKYADMGGLTPENFAMVSNELHSLQKIKEETRNSIKEFFEKKINYLILEKMIRRLCSRIDKEKPARYIAYLNDMRASKLYDESMMDEISRLSSFTTSLCEDDKYLELKGDDEILIKDIHKIRNILKADYKQITQSVDVNQELIKNLKSKIEITQTREMEKELDIIFLAIKEKEYLENSVNEKIELVSQMEFEIVNLQDDITRLKKEVFEQTKNNDSYVLAKKYLDVANDFYNDEIRRYTKIISKEATALLKKTYRKRNYISKIEIDENFVVKLFNKSEEKKIEQLSAGEKQLFVATIMVTIFKLSKRNVMLLFDTPAGRLDNNHMLSFYKNVMLDSGNQVIIMPTSKELNGDVIKTIFPRVNTCYTINYLEEGYSQIDEGIIFGKEW